MDEALLADRAELAGLPTSEREAPVLEHQAVAVGPALKP